MRLGLSIMAIGCVTAGAVAADPLYDAAIESFLEALWLEVLSEEDNRRSAACFVDMLDESERRDMVEASTRMDVYTAMQRISNGAAARCEMAIWKEAGLQ